ncbi:hypothetical protein AB0M50_24800 [Nonomuraea fuscirosea]|uniref:hypothetical protein n=1 Tax=Nonomuraea fuscirosea TaxID=1291556 RepID=UPI002DDBB170|nr:hypothetical protein [Nonomuraea fuscirosea]WSA57037.1 hypothetical protein OIE67_21210 [Nonomuraea fuscirosea]
MAEHRGGCGEALVEQLGGLALMGPIGALFGGLLAVLGGFDDLLPTISHDQGDNAADAGHHG